MVKSRIGLGLALAVLAVLVGAAEPASVVAPDAATSADNIAIARDIVATAYPVERRSAMFGGIVDAMTAQFRGATMGAMENNPGAKAIVNRYLDANIAQSKVVLERHIPALMESIAQAYTHEFDRDELIAVLAFVRTPAGGHFFMRGSALLADPAVSSANQALIRELEPISQKTRRDLTAELTAYLADHPPAPAHGL